MPIFISDLFLFFWKSYIVKYYNSSVCNTELIYLISGWDHLWQSNCNEQKAVTSPQVLRGRSRYVWLLLKIKGGFVKLVAPRFTCEGYDKGIFINKSEQFWSEMKIAVTQISIIQVWYNSRASWHLSDSVESLTAVFIPYIDHGSLRD